MNEHGHTATARRVAGGRWYTHCPSCGEVGNGLPLRYLELARNLAASHHHLYDR
jgi:hypothetical protein